MMLAGIPTHHAVLCHWRSVRLGHIYSAAPNRIRSAVKRAIEMPVFLMNIFHKAGMGSE